MECIAHYSYVCMHGGMPSSVYRTVVVPSCIPIPLAGYAVSEQVAADENKQNKEEI